MLFWYILLAVSLSILITSTVFILIFKHRYPVYGRVDIKDSVGDDGEDVMKISFVIEKDVDFEKVEYILLRVNDSTDSRE